jgi:hypothetical protein
MQRSIARPAGQAPGLLARGWAWMKGEPGLWVVLCLYLASRITYVALGLKFDTKWASDYGMHLLAPDLLKNDLWRSIYYLHGQPPLFNLFYAAILRLSPGNDAFGFQVSYWILGVITAVSLYVLLRRLRVQGAIAAAITVIFTLGSSAIFYETRGFYEHVDVTLLVVTTLLFEEYFRTRRTGTLAALFSALAAIVLIRTTFHLAWMVVCLALVLFFDWKNWRKVVLVFCIPFLLATGWYAKNYFVFGQFTASTWTGLNIGRISTYMLPHYLRYPLIDQGKISSLAHLDSVFDYRLDQHQELKTGIPALDQVYKTPGNFNYNNVNVIPFSQQLLKDALTVIRLYPKNYLTNVYAATMTYFQQSSYFSTYPDTPPALLEWEKIDQAIYYKTWFHTDPSVPASSNTLLHLGSLILGHVDLIMVGYALAILLGIIYLLRSLFRRDPANPRQPAIVFIVFMLIYISVVSNVAELGTNFRFRYIADPFFWLLTGLGLSWAWGRARTALRGKASGPDRV